MAKEADSAAMREEFKRWLTHRGIDLNDVREDFSLIYSGGMTQITFTMLVNDFPVPKPVIRELHISKKGSDECTEHCRHEKPSDG